MSYIHGSSLVDTSRVNISNSSLKLFSFEKDGIIEINKVRTRIVKNDNLQSLVNKINNKTSLHGVKARLGKERGHDVIYLSASKEIKIIDVKGILNNVSISIIVKPESNYSVHNLLNEEFYLFLATRWDTNNLPSRPFAMQDCEISEVQSNNCIDDLNYSFDSLFQSCKSLSSAKVSDENNQNPQSVTVAFHRQDKVNNCVRTRNYSLGVTNLEEYICLSPEKKIKVDAFELYQRLLKPEQQQLLTFAQQSVRKAKENLSIQGPVSEIAIESLLFTYLPRSLGVTPKERTRACETKTPLSSNV